jgi:hypothetical protein
MAEAKSGPDWQKITGCTIAGFVLLCILMALAGLALIFIVPIVSMALDAL